MNRDWDLIRDVLLQIEAHPAPKMPGLDYGALGTTRPDGDEPIEDPRRAFIHYNVGLAVADGLVKASPLESARHGAKRVLRYHSLELTPQGHEFLDAARDAEIWNRAKKRAGGQFGQLAFEVLKDLLISLGRSTLGL